MLSSLEQAFVGREELRAPLKTPAWEAKVSIESIAVGTSVIKPVECVRNLGAWFENHMSMDTHVVKVCSKLKLFVAYIPSGK